LIIANLKQQEVLLEVAKLDLAIARGATTLSEAETNAAADEMRTKLLHASELLLQAHANQENLQGKIKKLASDVELVEARIEHDQKKAQQVSTEREQKAVAQELANLQARKSALEDSELEHMDELEQASQEVQELTQSRAAMSLALEKLMAKQHGETLTLSAQLDELKAKRTATFSQLTEEIQSTYTKKSNRGIAVAQTLGRDCSACRLAINAVQFESMMAEPEDHVPTCPNCDAMIIR
jgi:predicted  nucleic acid-binding Zn-ribbon protein